MRELLGFILFGIFIFCIISFCVLSMFLYASLAGGVFEEVNKDLNFLKLYKFLIITLLVDFIMLIIL